MDIVYLQSIFIHFQLMVKQSKQEREKVVVLESDKKLVQGLIDRDPGCEQTFLNQYREFVLGIFTTAHEKMKIKAKLTDKMKESLFDALCENLHSSDDRQLKQFLEGEREKTFSAFLMKKAAFFCRDMLWVEGLKKGDKEITERSFYGKKRDDPLSSFQPMMINALNAYDIRDYENGGRRMSSINFASDMYDQLMSRLNENKFRFEGYLHTFFFNVLRTRIKELIKDITIDQQIVDIEDYGRSRDSVWLVCVEYEKKEMKEFYEGVFNNMIQRGVDPKHVEVLKCKYLEGLSAKEIAEKQKITENLVNQWVFRTKQELIKSLREFK